MDAGGRSARTAERKFSKSLYFPGRICYNNRVSKSTRSSMDRASDSGSECWGFESLRVCHSREACKRLHGFFLPSARGSGNPGYRVPRSAGDPVCSRMQNMSLQGTRSWFSADRIICQAVAPPEAGPLPGVFCSSPCLKTCHCCPRLRRGQRYTAFNHAPATVL